MADFETETELQVAVEQRSLRNARQTIESELSDVTVAVESTPDTRAMRPDGGAGAFGGGGIGESMVDLQSEQVELLESIDESLEGTAGVGGGGGGGLLPSFAAGAAGGAGTGGGGFIRSLLLSGAMTPGSPFFFGSGSSPDTERIDRAAEGDPQAFGPLMRPIAMFLQDMNVPDVGPPESGGVGRQPVRPDQPGTGGGGGGLDIFAGIEALSSPISTLMDQSPQWLDQFANQVDRLESLQPPDRPANLPEDPRNMGRPEEGPIGPGQSGRRGRAGQAGRGNTTVNRQLDMNISIEDRREINEEMRNIEQRLREALRGDRGGI